MKNIEKFLNRDTKRKDGNAMSPPQKRWNSLHLALYDEIYYHRSIGEQKPSTMKTTPTNY